MAQAHHFLRPGGAAFAEPPRLPPPDFPFRSLVLSEPRSRARGLFGGLGTSMTLHTLLVLAVVIVPTLLYEAIPEPGAAVRAFFSTPTVLRGHPLFDEAAVAAVRQWRYRPLLLNGEPTEFILTVTVFFNLSSPAEAKSP